MNICIQKIGIIFSCLSIFTCTITSNALGQEIDGNRSPCVPPIVSRDTIIHKGLEPLQNSLACNRAILKKTRFIRNQRVLADTFYKSIAEYASIDGSNPTCKAFLRAGHRLSVDLLNYTTALNYEVKPHVSYFLRARLEILNMFLRQYYLLIKNKNEAGLGLSNVEKSTCLDSTKQFTVVPNAREVLVNVLEVQLHILNSLIRSQWGKRGLENYDDLTRAFTQLVIAGDEASGFVTDIFNFFKFNWIFKFKLNSFPNQELKAMTFFEAREFYDAIIAFSKVGFSSTGVYLEIVKEMELLERNLIMKCSQDANCLQVN